MEFKKRKADLQLTSENVDQAEPTYTTPDEKISDKQESKPSSGTTPVAAAAPVLGGFSSYAKSNPFASAMANNTNKSPFGGGGSGAAAAASTSFGSASASSRNAFSMPPPLTLPSPKSPKANPFSSPSPAHNPFMTYVENNDDLWKTMANDKLTAEEVAKSSVFSEGRSRKSPIPRSSFFGGGSGLSSFSSVTATALATGSTPTSIFKSSSSSGPANATTSAADDEDEDGGDENAFDGDGYPSANHASMKIISLPENLKLVTGEEDDECMLQMRAKMFRLNAHIEAINNVSKNGGNNSSSGASNCSSNSTDNNHNEAETTVTASTGSDTVTAAVDQAVLAANSVLDAVVKEKSQSSTKAKPASATKAAEWVEVGIGPLKILNRRNGGNVPGSGRLVMRREDKQGGIGTKLLMNARLDKLLTVSKPSDKMIKLICVNHAEVPLPGASSTGATIGTYLIKTKTSDEADDIYSIVHDFVSKSKDFNNTCSNDSEKQNDEQKQEQKKQEAHEDDGNNSPLKSAVPQRVREPSPTTIQE